MLCDHCNFPEARAVIEDILAMTEATCGPEHPQVAIALDKLTQVLISLGDFSLARSTAERALKINETTLGPHHVKVASNLLQLARVLKEQNELAAIFKPGLCSFVVYYSFIPGLHSSDLRYISQVYADLVYVSFMLSRSHLYLTRLVA
jgi:hypothetical protein